MNYLDYFKEIARIPHGSGNTDQISKYLLDFANENGFFAKRDEYNNVIIIREAHPNYVNHEPVIIQGHMDMVAVKANDSDKDMEFDGLELYTDGDYLKAKDTSLGGDDGIAVAYIMDILTGDYKTPRIEAIITVDEEIGMLGADKLDVGMITATRMLNIDNEEEGKFIVSCAGGSRVEAVIPTDKTVMHGTKFTISVGNLKGGHSGIDIDKKRGNAIKILGEELCKLYDKINFKLLSIRGGEADNVIANSATAEIMLTDDTNPLLFNEVNKLNGTDFYFGDEKDIDMALITVTCDGQNDFIVFDDDSTKRTIGFIASHPYGVTAYNEEDPTIVETSVNIGMVTFEEEEVIVTSLVRSQTDLNRDQLVYELCKLSKGYGANTQIGGTYPGWPLNSKSELCKLAVEVYTQLGYGEPTVEAIHAGLECGVFASKIVGLDCISFGPQIDDIHTVNEKMSLSSAQRCFDFLVHLLEKM